MVKPRAQVVSLNIITHKNKLNNQVTNLLSNSILVAKMAALSMATSGLPSPDCQHVSGT